jgi:hypothetical protein
LQEKTYISEVSDPYSPGKEYLPRAGRNFLSPNRAVCAHLMEIQSQIVWQIDCLRGGVGRVKRTEEEEQEEMTRIFGIVLVVLGLIGLAWGGFSYTQREKVVDVGPIEATTETEKTVPIPPVAGAAAVIAGIALIAMGRDR